MVKLHVFVVNDDSLLVDEVEASVDEVEAIVSEEAIVDKDSVTDTETEEPVFVFTPPVVPS